MTPAAPDIFTFLDYRAYLRDWFEHRKARNPRYSHRLFARLAGQKSPSLLLAVIEGRRNLTAATRDSFLVAMKLKPAEARFFKELVDLDQATTDEERNSAWQNIRATKRFRDSMRIEGAAFDCLSHWYYAATHELANRPDFQAEAPWVARRLRPRIKVSEARQALEALTTLGLLAPDEHGHLRPAEATLTTPHEVLGLAVHNYHRGMSQLAGASVVDFAPEERHLLGVTVSIPESLVPALKDELNAIQARLLDLCDAAEQPAERVYQLNLQLFPLSAPPGGRMTSPKLTPLMALMLLTTFGACRAEGIVGEGIAVGNPGSTKLTTARSSGSTLLSAEGAMAELRLVDCSGDSLQLATNIALSLDGSSTLALPGGLWCGVGLSFDGPATFRHEVNGGTLELQLDLGDIEATGATFDVSGGVFLSQLGPEDWVLPAEWDLIEGETLVVAPGDPEHDALAAKVADWLQLAEDLDGDGELSANDAVVAATPAAEPDDEDDDEDDDDD